MTILRSSLLVNYLLNQAEEFLLVGFLFVCFGFLCFKIFLSGLGVEF